MNEDFCTYEQAVKLKELGFDWDCDFWYYYDYIDDKPIFERCEITDYYEVEDYWYVPTLAQVQKWLREVKDIYVFANKAIAFPTTLKGKFYWEIINKELEVVGRCYSCDLTDTYEEALSIGIDKALELLTQQKNDELDAETTETIS